MINQVRRFFLVCSGATVELLERPECKTEVTRYAMMGAFVALTAAFASLSGGYALYTGFKTLILAVPVGFLWGAFIFTLDRFIVSSIRKQRVENHLTVSEKALIKLQEFGAALPRLILAAFIAMTVAIPLEMKYFESEIDARLAENNLNAAPEIALTALKGFPEIEEREKELQALVDKEKAFTERRNLLRDQQRKEEDGVPEAGTSGLRGHGPRSKRRLEEYEQAETELAALLSDNAPKKEKLQQTLEELRAKAAGVGAGTRRTIEQGNGFLARYKALNELAAEGPVKSLTIFLIILLTLIETTPVLIKLFAGRGPYDDLLDTAEHKVYVDQQKQISDFNSDVNTDLEIYKKKCQVRRQREETLLQDPPNTERAETRPSGQSRYAERNGEGDEWSLEMESVAKD